MIPITTEDCIDGIAIVMPLQIRAPQRNVRNVRWQSAGAGGGS